MGDEEEEQEQEQDANEEQNADDEELQLPPRPEEEDEKEEKELLFLIEFLVDTLTLIPENMAVGSMDPCLLQGENCVVLTFMYYPPMCICENDLDPCRIVGENVTKFNAGKSLMFALSESQFEDPPPINLDVTVHKKLPHGSFPTKLPIGMTRILLTELFKQVFEKVDERPDKLPLSKSIKDTYQLMGGQDKATAEITIYIRLSCLGQNIVTEFQRGGDDCQPMIFKNKESNKFYECLPKGEVVDDSDDVCPACPGWGSTTPKNICDSPRGNFTGCTAGDSRNDQEAEDEESEYEEFGTEVHGHALTIKVKKSKKAKSSGQGSRSPSCLCDQSGGKTKSGNQITFQVPQDQSLCKKGKKKATVCNVNSSSDGKKEILQILPQSDEASDKDIFVLRIGRKGEVYGQGKLELELRTPKQRVDVPPRGPRMFDSSAQTEKEEQPKKGRKK